MACQLSPKWINEYYNTTPITLDYNLKALNSVEINSEAAHVDNRAPEADLRNTIIYNQHVSDARTVPALHNWH